MNRYISIYFDEFQCIVIRFESMVIRNWLNLRNIDYKCYEGEYIHGIPWVSAHAMAPSLNTRPSARSDGNRPCALHSGNPEGPEHSYGKKHNIIPCKTYAATLYNRHDHIQCYKIMHTYMLYTYLYIWMQ